ncbi:MAG: SDR family oxidoreductase [Syntrophomonadaceae bacterium]
MKLKDKVAVVTGAASGMGRAIAIRYAEGGAKVVAADINSGGVQDTVSVIQAVGGTAVAVLCNVAKEEDIQKMIRTAVSEYGTLDILVNNAGIMDNMEPPADITDEQWERIFAVNTISVMRATRKAVPIFLAKGSGVIINVASIGGLYGKVAGAIYTASKHAVIGFTKSTAFMYATQGIRCNAIAPGAVQTNIGQSMTNVNEFGASRTGLSLSANPGFGQPEEIAGVALFLASDDSSFVNGAVIVADGGWTT